MSNKVIYDQKSVEKVLDLFSRTTETIVSLDELKKLLLSGKQLVMKYGVDVTAPDLHIGHAVNLWMYRALQDMGHKLIFLIGDFTTQIGDPTGRNKTRPVISQEDIDRNAKEFMRQAMLVLRDDSKVCEIKKNSQWFSKMDARGLIQIMSLVTNDHLLNRDMFRKRIEEGKEIYEHEVIYPILQAYDSVELKADLTIIGTDQLYNEMLGRTYQEKFNLPPQVIITTKITAGIDGREKQSKSWGNYVGLAHTPREKFGRLMSISDDLILSYLEVYTEVAMEEIKGIRKDIEKNPMQYKIFLAQKVVERYHGKKVADDEVEWFKKTFSNKEIPDDAPKVSIGKDSATVLEILRAAFPTKDKSNGDLRRLIEQGAVTLAGEVYKKFDQEVKIPAKGLECKVGKKNWFVITRV